MASTPNALKSDFKVFLYAVWHHLRLPPPTRSQYAIADWLQHGEKQMVIEAFRGVGKSWVTAAFVCWLLLNDPDLKIMVVSASKIYADAFSSFTQRLINEVSFLKHLRPKEGQHASKIMFDVGPARASKDPSVKSVGITGQLSGSRADVIIADDVEVPNNSETQMMRDKLSEQIKEFAAIIKPVPEFDVDPRHGSGASRVIYLGTPQTEQSLYNRLPERGYAIHVLPARYPSEAEMGRYGDRLASYLLADLERDPSLAGKPTCSRFSEDALLRSIGEYGRSGFSLQFMLDTSLSDADRYPLKLHDLIVMDVDPYQAPVDLAWGNDRVLAWDDVPTVGLDGDRFYKPFMVSKDTWLPYQGVVMAIDPAGRGGDEVGYAVVAMLHGRLYLLAAGGLQGGYEDKNLIALAQTAKRYRVNTAVVEPNMGDGMFNKLLEPVMHRIHPCSIEETERSLGNKEKRIIDTLEPVMNQHKLVVDRSLIEADYKSTLHHTSEMQQRFRLFYQMTRITRDKGALRKDDRVDALALAVHYWTEMMNRDSQRAVDQSRADALQRELRSFVDNILFQGPRPVSVYERP